MWYRVFCLQYWKFGPFLPHPLSSRQFYKYHFHNYGSLNIVKSMALFITNTCYILKRNRSVKYHFNYGSLNIVKIATLFITNTCYIWGENRSVKYPFNCPLQILVILEEKKQAREIPFYHEVPLEQSPSSMTFPFIIEGKQRQSTFILQMIIFSLIFNLLWFWLTSFSITLKLHTL